MGIYTLISSLFIDTYMYEETVQGKVKLFKGLNNMIKRKVSSKSFFRYFIVVFSTVMVYFFYILIEYKKTNSTTLTAYHSDHLISRYLHLGNKNFLQLLGTYRFLKYKHNFMLFILISVIECGTEETVLSDRMIVYFSVSITNKGRSISDTHRFS